MREAVIVAYGRSPIGKSRKGKLNNVNPVDLSAQVIKGVFAKLPKFDISKIEDIVMGCATPEGVQGQNVARNIGIRAGFPYSVGGQTINRFCSSGIQAISIAANSIKVGEQDIVLAGGVESMSLLPMGGNLMSPDYITVKEYPGAYSAMGTTAENVAEKYGITRLMQDEFAVESNKKAALAQKEGRFMESIIPIKVENSFVNEDGKIETKQSLCDKDEGIRSGTTMESLSRLKPAFRLNGSVTAGNSSQTSDGAAVVLLMSKEKADELGMEPIAKFKEFAVAGVDPEYMGLGPIPAITKLLKVTGLRLEDIDLIELNEAFASQSIVCINELNLDKGKVNPNGGAIALGHPLGCTGAFLTIKMIDELKRQNKKKGIVSMCIGGGQGAAGIIELC